MPVSVPGCAPALALAWGVPDVAKTPARNIRIPDALWQAAKKRAAEQHTSVSALVIRALQREIERR